MMIEWLESHDGLAAWVAGIATSLALIWALWQARSDARARADAAAVKIQALLKPVSEVRGEFAMMLEHAFNAPPPDGHWRATLRSSSTLAEAIHRISQLRPIDMPSPTLVRLHVTALRHLQHLSSVLFDERYDDDVQELAEQLQFQLGYLSDDEVDIELELRRHYAPAMTAIETRAKGLIRRWWPDYARRTFGPERYGTYPDC